MMDSIRWGFASLIVALVLLTTGRGTLQAQTGAENPQARAEAEAAIAQLRSPYCPGRMLENCTSSAAGLLRDSIYELAEQGASTEELVEWMLARHGEEFRGVPQGEGAGLFAWIIPPLAGLAALGLLVLWLRSNRNSTGGGTGVAPSAISDSDRRELAEALRTWESTAEHDR